MSNLQVSVDQLHHLCVDVAQISATADEMLSWLQRALTSVQHLGGTRAEAAEAQIREAQAAVRDARTVWIEDFIRRSEDLGRRIAS